MDIFSKTYFKVMLFIFLHDIKTIRPYSYNEQAHLCLWYVFSLAPFKKNLMDLFNNCAHNN